MRALLLTILVATAGFCFAQPTKIRGLLSVEFSYYNVQFNDVGVMINPSSPNTQQPDNPKMVSFGGAFGGGVVFPFQAKNNWNFGVRLTGGMLIHHIHEKGRSTHGTDRFTLQTKALAYVNHIKDDKGWSLVAGPKYTMGSFANLTGVIGAERVDSDKYSILFYTTTHAYKAFYEVSNGSTSNMLTMRELIGVNFIIYR